MTLNELCGRIHLPSLMGFCGMGSRFNFYKIPGFGWYGKALDSNRIFNFVEVLKLYHSLSPRMESGDVMRFIYQFVTRERREFLELPTTYSETNENRIVSDYMLLVFNTSVYNRAREEALNGNIRFNDRVHKFTKLLDDKCMSEFIKSGVGILTPKVLADIKSKMYPIPEKHTNRMLIPSYFSPDGRIASLESCPVTDIAVREHFYFNQEFGWHGRFGEPLVGNLSDLLTIGGCTWDRKLGYWGQEKPVTLHHSLQPAQCLDIWLHSNGMPTDKNPLDVLKATGRLNTVKDHLKNLPLSKLRELEKHTAQPLYDYWVEQRYQETLVSGMKFSCRDTCYYYARGTEWLEFTNFTVNLSYLKKEDGEWYQYGAILMKNQEVEFKAKRKDFVSHHALIQTLTDILLEAGVGVPTIAPNLRHYLVNVIDSFNTENRIEKPVAKEEPSEDILVRNIAPGL